MEVVTADRRVACKEHLRPHLGPYGGKCVPKDTRELINASGQSFLLRAVESVNLKVSQKESDRELIERSAISMSCAAVRQ